MTQTAPNPIRACTISRDVQNFDLLIEDMETAMGDAWGDLGFAEALAFLAQPEAENSWPWQWMPATKRNSLC
jgi:pilus assembly protein CpaE